MRCKYLFVVFLAATVAQAQYTPTYTCLKTSVPPVIDGKGDDAAWQRAPLASLVDVEDLTGTKVHSRPTQIAMLWDEENLYVLFVATDPDVWSTLANRDDHLWNEEVVELYTDPDGDGQNYAEIEVNPLNTIVDLLLTKPYRQGGSSDFGWSPEYQTAVHVEGTINDPADVDQYWSMEMALPWEALRSAKLDVLSGRAAPPAVGDQWRFNFYRYERLRNASGRELKVEYSAWSPVGRIDFHVPERFGVVIFGEPSSPVLSTSWAELKAEHQTGR